MDESLNGVVGNELTAEELENKRKDDRELYEKAKHFKAIIESEDWKEAEKTLKDDIYANLHDDKHCYHMCWGVKMCIGRIHAWANKADELLKEYGGSV